MASEFLEQCRHRLSPELRLLALLSLPSPSSDQLSRAQQCLNDAIDPALFRRLLDQHRVWPCVHLNIRDHFPNSLPIGVTDYLSKKYHDSVRRVREHLAAQLLIRSTFKQAGIKSIVMKGTTLATALYKDVAKRHSSDIDILISKDDLKLANELLNKIGFFCDLIDNCGNSSITIDRLKNKDRIYRNSRSLVLELHFLIFSPSVHRIQGIERDILNRNDDDWIFTDDGLIYHCWHVASFGNPRLKWFTDIALFIDHQDWVWPRIAETATNYDYIRAVVGTLAICGILFRSPVPDFVWSELDGDRGCRRFVKRSLDQMNGTPVFGGKELSLYGVKLSRRPGNRIAALMANIHPSTVDLARLPLPGILAYLHYPLRPIMIILRRLSII